MDSCLRRNDMHFYLLKVMLLIQMVNRLNESVDFNITAPGFKYLFFEPDITVIPRFAHAWFKTKFQEKAEFFQRRPVN